MFQRKTGAVDLATKAGFDILTFCGFLWLLTVSGLWMEKSYNAPKEIVPLRKASA